MSDGVCGVIVSTTKRKIVRNIGMHLNMIKSTIKMVRFTRQRLDNHFNEKRTISITTQAIQSVATLGLRVEDSYGGSGFWQDVIEYARKGKVQVDELKKAGDEIRNFTGWNDPVDALSTFAQVNAQDVLVEEKRKRAEEADPAKRHETREQKRREMEKGATEPKEADKVKGKTSGAK